MEGKADTPEVLAARDGMLAALKTFEATFLRNSRFVAGDELCIADISIVCGGRPPSTHCSAPQAGFKVLHPLGGRTDAEAPLVVPPFLRHRAVTTSSVRGPPAGSLRGAVRRAAAIFDVLPGRGGSHQRRVCRGARHAEGHGGSPQEQGGAETRPGRRQRRCSHGKAVNAVNTSFSSLPLAVLSAVVVSNPEPCWGVLRRRGRSPPAWARQPPEDSVGSLVTYACGCRALRISHFLARSPGSTLAPN